MAIEVAQQGGRVRREATPEVVDEGGDHMAVGAGRAVVTVGGGGGGGGAAAKDLVEPMLIGGSKGGLRGKGGEGSADGGLDGGGRLDLKDEVAAGGGAAGGCDVVQKSSHVKLLLKCKIRFKGMN